MWFQKYPYSTHGRPLEIPRGRGTFLKAKLSEEKCEAKLEFPRDGGGGGEGEGVQNKTLSMGEYGYFLELDAFR